MADLKTVELSCSHNYYDSACLICNRYLVKGQAEYLILKNSQINRLLNAISHIQDILSQHIMPDSEISAEKVVEVALSVVDDREFLEFLEEIEY